MSVTRLKTDDKENNDRRTFAKVDDMGRVDSPRR